VNRFLSDALVRARVLTQIEAQDVVDSWRIEQRSYLSHEASTD
jgi:hypothetical protein